MQSSKHLRIDYVAMLCLVFNSALGIAHGQTRPVPNLASYPYPNAGAKIGQGWDSFNEAGTGAACVDVAEVQLESTSFQTTVEQIQSTYSFLTKIASSVTASYSGFGAHASGNLSASSSVKINSDDQNYLFTFRSSNGSTFAAPATSNPEHANGPTDRDISVLNSLKSDGAQQAYLGTLSLGPPSYFLEGLN
jgi:hypothetical protein